MVKKDISAIFESQYNDIISKIEIWGPKVLGAVLILAFGTIISIGLYKLVLFLFKKFKLKEFIDKLDLDIIDDSQRENGEKVTGVKKIKFSEKFKVDKLVGKSVSYYVFLVFFRLSIVFIGIKEVEDFLGDLIAYLPNLFIGVVIGFFGNRFSNFIYDLVYHTLELTKEKTSKIIAMSAKVVILFFTIMLVLNYVKIVDEFIIHTIFVGFIATLSLALGLSFGLGGKKVASEILESFRR